MGVHPARPAWPVPLNDGCRPAQGERVAMKVVVNDLLSPCGKWVGVQGVAAANSVNQKVTKGLEIVEEIGQE
jgi:hypothetical protein